MSDPVPSSAISDATTGGLSVIVITGGSTGDVLTKQSDGTYAAAAPSSGGVTTLGTTGTNLNISGSTLNVPDASATARGVVTTGDQTFAGIKTFANVKVPAGAYYNIGLQIGSQGIISPGAGKLALVLGGSEYQQFYNGIHYCSQVTFSGSFVPDVSIQKSTTDIVEINNGTLGQFRDLKLRNLIASGLLCAGQYTVATLPSASANAYKFATVSDSSVTTFGSTVAGSGSSKVMVYSNGTNWTVCAA
jgi:hypothetical protein